MRSRLPTVFMPRMKTELGLRKLDYLVRTKDKGEDAGQDGYNCPPIQPPC